MYFPPFNPSSSIYTYYLSTGFRPDILLLQDCPSLAMLCLFAPLTGHSKTVICTFWGRKFRGKKRKVLLFKSCQNRNLIREIHIKGIVGHYVMTASCYSACAQHGASGSHFFWCSWDTRSAFQVSELGKAISSSSCFLCNVIKSIIPFVPYFCVCFAPQ